MNTFSKELIRVIDSNLYNYYLDNFDRYRFNKNPNRFKDYIIYFLSKIGVQNRSVSLTPFINLIDHLDALEETYNLLSDKKSKELFTLIFAYRILGYRKIKLPLNDLNFKRAIRKLERTKQKKNFIDSGFKHFLLYKHNLKPIGIPIEIYFTTLGIWHDFIVRQYEYKTGEKHIKAVEGDIVLDCGACWGDTALYFANEVGQQGKVYSFEFIDSNVKIFNLNISANPYLADRIILIKNPLWSESNVSFYVNDNGPASKVTETPRENLNKINTITIDSFVEDYNISKINFIKMDIEGAELNALKGAVNTLKKFKPKLAIALYHKIEDFYEIPLWLNGLKLGYKFYLGHYSIHHEETILFAET